MDINNIYLADEFERIWQKIENGENISILRYGDGERAFMTGRQVTAQENWVSPEYISETGKALLATLELEGDNIYHAISCPCCDKAAYYWYSSRINNINRTFANLFININYQNFIERFSKLERKAIVIANKAGENKPIGQLDILKYYSVGDDPVLFWEQEAKQLLEQIKDEYGQENNLLYVVSAGPMAEPIIAELYKNNPNNSYIDFGSAIDCYIHQIKTRPYEDPKSPYAKRNCVMDKPESLEFDISVVLNLYKRPENLKEQLECIQKQTIKPREILLYQDGTGDTVAIPEDIKEYFDVIEISPINKGVWARFEFAQRIATSKYLCVFDDDTMCGECWLENCYTHMQEAEGLYGTIGIMLEKADEYPLSKSHFRVGWATPLDIKVKVDFVGHSWFFKHIWLEELFKAPKEIQNFKYVGEDMAFSYQLQKINIPTFVPPHPINDFSLFGSLPSRAWTLGTNEVATSIQDGNYAAMTEAIQILTKDWQTIAKKDYNYFKKIKYMIFRDKSFTLFRIQTITKYHIITILGIPIHIKRKAYKKSVKKYPKEYGK